MFRVRRWFAVILFFVLLAQSMWAAQSEVRELRVEIVQGNGARNIIGRMPTGPVGIRVLDQDNRPVPGASVVFSVPDDGAGGSFPTDSQFFMTVTDQNGRAFARFQPNEIEGEYNIRVLARASLITEIADIRQTNVAAVVRSPKSSAKMITILAIAAAAAGAGIGLSSRGGNGNSGNQTPASVPSITFGNSSIGAPH